jgi:hypothetical protein
VTGGDNPVEDKISRQPQDLFARGRLGGSKIEDNSTSKNTNLPNLGKTVFVSSLNKFITLLHLLVVILIITITYGILST